MEKQIEFKIKLHFPTCPGRLHFQAPFKNKRRKLNQMVAGKSLVEKLTGILGVKKISAFQNSLTIEADESSRRKIREVLDSYYLKYIIK